MTHGYRRRDFIAAIAGGAGALAATSTAAAVGVPAPPSGRDPTTLAGDEAFWAEVAGFYDRTEGIVNLEHGYWGKMARPVRDFYLAATTRINQENSVYGRGAFAGERRESVRRIAAALGVAEDEIALTRNATEAIHNLIRQYMGLGAGDAILYADVDYPQFKTTMQWLEQGRGVRAVRIALPARATQAQLLARYRTAFDSNPDLRLMLITHVSNQHGLVIPVAQIAAEARKRGIDVICDCAQSWGLLDYRVEDLGVDWIGFNLHKWIGSPVGVGALYMRRGSLEKIAPYPGESDPDHTDAGARIHMGTANFAAMVSVPAALDFHQAVGGANKEARLRHLRRSWTEAAESMPHIELLGGADEASWTGMAAFRLRGKSRPEDARALQRRLQDDFGIFTVVRKGLDSGHCVRITPQVFSRADDLAQLVTALEGIGRRTGS